MRSLLRASPFNFVGASIALGAFVALLWPAVLGDLLRTDGYAPHGYCILWQPSLLWFHVGADLLIGLSYVAIAATLAYLVYRARRDIPFRWILLAFGAFIIACGGTHFMEIWTFWTPVYWLSGYVKLITAVASVATAVALPPLVPRTLRLVNNAKLAQQRQRELAEAHAELEQLYAQVKELDSLKTSFFANVSHELRTPLTLILGPSEQLLGDASLSVEQHDLVSLIARNARLLLRQVNDLLDVAKLDAAQIELNVAPIDLAGLLRTAGSYFDSMLRARDIRMGVVAPERLMAHIDADRIQQVLINLLSNAVKFTPAGGTVRCTLVADEQGGVLLRVEDSGPGIPAAQRELVFERFRQLEQGPARRYGGTGLGLPIARALVELHGGTLVVGDSALGGACFELRLPQAQMPQHEAVVAGDPALAPPALAPLEFVAPDLDGEDGVSGPPEAPLLLIVEDNPEMRRFLVATLSDSYRTATASDGRVGLERALALRPDLVLTDAMMPGMSGDQLVQALRAHEELCDVPAVILTARADDALRVAALRGGAQDYLVKPFAAAELRARLANLVAMKRVRDTLRQSIAQGSQDVAVLASEVAARQRQLEQAASENARLYQEAQTALRMREEFFAIAAHELKTPLTTLLGTAHLMLRRAEQDGDLAERYRRATASIAEQSDRLSALVEQFLDLSRIERGLFVVERAPLDLAALLRQLSELVQPTLEHHRLELGGEPSLTVQGDALRLEEVFQQLISNAVKYSPDGGSIALRLERRESWAAVIVRDQGIGIPSESLGRLFERFYRAPNTEAHFIRGLGIGLYMAQNIVAMHGGSIEVASAEGQGSAFTVLLPLAADSPPR